jgi:DNA-binding SARP family transcriptional activator/DNA-binding CsgD family transcriptional regulator
VDQLSLRIKLLDGFGLQVGERMIPPAAVRGKPSLLIKLLALAPGHRLHREVVVDCLWPDLDPEAALNNLHGVLRKLRLALEPGLAQGGQSAYVRLTDAQLILCAPTPVWVDAEVFEHACASARGSDDPATYTAALELYRGDLLPGDRYADWASPTRDSLRQSYIDLLLRLATAHERRQELWAAIGALNRVVATDPFQEVAHIRLMRDYAQAGRRVDALRQYQRLTNSLRELDVEPDSEARRLLADILAGRLRSARPAIRIADLGAWDEPKLSGRERDVINLVARGYTNRKIALLLGLSPRTAETHVSRILRKMGVPSREQAAAWASMRIRTLEAAAD